MTFTHPLLLLTLLMIPAGLLLYRLIVARRRMRYAVRYTNVDVLAAVVAAGRPWRRWLAAGAFLVALATLCVAVSGKIKRGIIGQPLWPGRSLTY